MFIFVAFKSHTEWNNAQRVSVLTTMILPATEGNDHVLNCFGHMIYVLQTNTYD